MISKGIISKKIINSLWQRWPDPDLLKSYYTLLEILKKGSQRLAKELDELSYISFKAFQEVCQFVIDIQSENPSKNIKSYSCKIGLDPPQNIILNKDKWANLNKLQNIASLLGMLMHFSPCAESPGLLANRRRPKKRFTTYPTSPSVTSLLAYYSLKHSLTNPIPSCCRSLADAKSYVKRSLSFRILDPSMESGQLLLEVALSLLRLVYRQHSPSSREASFLNKALLEYLCENCLWGIDRNPKAILAVQTVFSILFYDLGISNLSLANLLRGNSLEYFNGGYLPSFDCILNNPPWGEFLGPRDPSQILEFETTKHQRDTYIAFSELAIRSLQPHGVYALVLPSQSIATRNSSLMRDLIISKTHLEYIVLLPRTAFAEATVRGLMLLGRMKAASLKPSHVNIIKYPIEKAISSKGDVLISTILQADFESLGGSPWVRVLNVSRIDSSNVLTVKLGQVAEIFLGVQIYCKGRGNPPQTHEIVKSRPFNSSLWFPGAVPAIRGRNVLDFQMKQANEFVKFGPWLARVGQHEKLKRIDRIFVREISRRDGKLNAAIGEKEIIPLHGVITVVPKMINIYALVAILNSFIVSDHVKNYSASFSKVDFQKITISELKQIPIPATLILRDYRKELGLKPISNIELEIQKKISRLVKGFTRLLKQNSTSTNEDRKRIEEIIAELYGRRMGCKNE